MTCSCGCYLDWSETESCLACSLKLSIESIYICLDIIAIAESLDDGYHSVVDSLIGMTLKCLHCIQHSL